MLKCITRSYKSAPRESLLIVSNLLPIDFIAFEIAALRFIKYNSLNFSIFSAKAIGQIFSDCDLVNMSAEENRKFQSSSCPPWYAPALTHHTVSEEVFWALQEGQRNIFASSESKENGSLVKIVCYSSLTVIDSQEVLLPAYTTSTQAEIVAIQTAIRFAVSKKLEYGTCNIFSSSKPALNRTMSFTKISQTVSENRELILENFDLFSFYWLPRNVVLEWTGGKAIATSTTSLADLKMSSSFLKKKLNNNMQVLWKKEWAETTKGAITRTFFPTPADASILKGSYISHQITQLLTGHCQLNYHFFKIKKISSPVCSCGLEDETVEHFIYTCHRFSSQRQSLKEACLKLIPVFPPPLSALATTPVIWKELLHFLKATRRLDHIRAE